MIGMAVIEADYPLYFDAMNEYGLAAAGLNFPGNAWYDPEMRMDRQNISPFELIPFVLGQCKNLKEARALLERIHLVAIPFSEAMALSPLHWHFADEEGSIALECTRAGMQIHENPTGVLTNNPPFDYQLLHLSQYQQLSPLPPENRLAPEVPLPPYGRGMGAIGLPGDYSPASRFVRAAFLRAHSVYGQETDSPLHQFFHLLEGVAMPRGGVVAENGRLAYTQYSCCMQKQGGIYYYKTYENCRITAASLQKADVTDRSLIAYPLRREGPIDWENAT